MGIPCIISSICHMALGEANREDSLSFPLAVVVIAVVVELAMGEEER